MCEHAAGAWKLLYDWQTLAAGLLALVAGVLTFAAGMKQVTEVRKQNDFLMRSESRHLDRLVLSASGLLEGVLRIVEENIDVIDNFGTDSSNQIEFASANQIRQKLEMPPHQELIPQLGQLGREVIDNYFSLCARISKFRNLAAATDAASLHGELDALRKVVVLLRDEVWKMGDRALSNLAIRNLT